MVETFDSVESGVKPSWFFTILVTGSCMDSSIFDIGVKVKLLPCDVEVASSSHRNSFCKVGYGCIQ